MKNNFFWRYAFLIFALGIFPGLSYAGTAASPQTVLISPTDNDNPAPPVSLAPSPGPLVTVRPDAPPLLFAEIQNKPKPAWASASEKYRLASTGKAMTMPMSRGISSAARTTN